MSELREIPNRRGYFLDIHGNFYSAWVNKGRHGLVLGDKPKKLYGSVGKNGYVLVSFGRRKREYLHRLMLEVFVGPCPIGKVACHRNDIRQDNRLENLYWGTPTQNIHDRRKNSHLNEGEHHGMSKLTDEQVKYIISMKGKKTQAKLAQELGVHPNTVFYIQKGYAWKHIRKQG